MALSPEEFQALRPVPVDVMTDRNGDLWKALCAGETGKGAAFGEIYVIRTVGGAVRGRHYHRRTTEWFMAIQGRMRCRLALPGTDLRSEFLLDGASPEVIKVPAGVAHSLSNEEQEQAVFLAYADQVYDREAPDAVPFDFE